MADLAYVALIIGTFSLCALVLRGLQGALPKSVVWTVGTVDRRRDAQRHPDRSSRRPS